MHSLVSAAQYNGMEATVLAFNTSKGQFKLSLRREGVGEAPVVHARQANFAIIAVPAGAIVTVVGHPAITDGTLAKVVRASQPGGDDIELELMKTLPATLDLKYLRLAETTDGQTRRHLFQLFRS
jgi:hypothetical protein